MLKTVFRIFMVLFIFASGALLSWNIFSAKPRGPQISSTVVISKLEEVCKLVTVEGFFTEEVEYNDQSDFSSYMDYLLIKNYLPVKATLRINAKVMAGYNMDNIRIQAFEEERKIVVSNIPEPEVLSVDHEVVYFEKDEWKFFNTLTDSDYVFLNQEASDKVREAAMDSELMDLARKNGNKMLDMMQFIAEASGWSFEIIGLDTQKAENFDTFE